MINKYSIYIVAGVATSLNFFNDFSSELERLYALAGKSAETHIIFPYGDWRTSVISQVNKVRLDLKHSVGNYELSAGGQQARRLILDTYSGGRIIIIGHSGGGVSGYYAARMLKEQDGLPLQQVIQIGSPKVKIIPAYQAQVAYLRVDKHISSDLITRLGSWGGFNVTRKSSIPYWNRFKYAPLHRSKINLIGGHADYFRKSRPFVDKYGVSNLTKTLKVILKWMED
jgi:hypothetical protein